MVPIKTLCRDWDGKKVALWTKELNDVVHQHSIAGHEEEKQAAALTYAQEGLFSNVCQILTSHGNAPYHSTTCNLSKAICQPT